VILDGAIGAGLYLWGTWTGESTKVGSVSRGTRGIEAVKHGISRHFGVSSRKLSIGAKSQAFIQLNNEKWVRYLEDPFVNNSKYMQKFSEGLLGHLEERLGRDTAMNHYRHAEKAHRALEGIVESDRKALGLSLAEFRLIVVFAFEVMDRYGRMLGLIDTYIEDEEIRKERPFYNLRLMKLGLVNPYLIWPNLDPFRKKTSLSGALFRPDQRDQYLKSEVGDLMKWTREAREKKFGVYDKDDPLLLERQ